MHCVICLYVEGPHVVIVHPPFDKNMRDDGKAGGFWPEKVNGPNSALLPQRLNVPEQST